MPETRQPTALEMFNRNQEVQIMQQLRSVHFLVHVQKDMLSIDCIKFISSELQGIVEELFQKPVEKERVNGVSAQPDNMATTD